MNIQNEIVLLTNDEVKKQYIVEMLAIHGKSDFPLRVQPVETFSEIENKMKHHETDAIILDTVPQLRGLSDEGEIFDDIDIYAMVRNIRHSNRKIPIMIVCDRGQQYQDFYTVLLPDVDIILPIPYEMAESIPEMMVRQINMYKNLNSKNRTIDILQKHVDTMKEVHSFFKTINEDLDNRKNEIPFAILADYVKNAIGKIFGVGFDFITQKTEFLTANEIDSMKTLDRNVFEFVKGQAGNQIVFVPDVDKRPEIKSISNHCKSFILFPLFFKAKRYGYIAALGKEKLGGEVMNEMFLSHFHQLLNFIALDKLWQGKYEMLFSSSMNTLNAAIEKKDNYTEGHSQRVKEYSMIIGRRFLGDHLLRRLAYSALLHDIGKIAVPENILNKDGKLSRIEQNKINEHPINGFLIMSNLLDANHDSDILGGIKYHHEDYNGKGYPDFLESEKIPQFARIIRITDSFDAMTSERRYSERKPPETAITEIIAQKGKKYDPDFADIFVDTWENDSVEILRHIPPIL